MKKLMMMFVVAVAAAMPTTTSGLDACDTMLRNQLGNIGRISSNGSADEGILSGAKAGEMMNTMYSAIESGNWDDALHKTIDYVNATRNSSLEPDVNRAQYYLYAFMLSWNTDRREKSREFLDRFMRLQSASTTSLGNEQEKE